MFVGGLRIKTKNCPKKLTRTTLKLLRRKKAKLR